MDWIIVDDGEIIPGPFNLSRFGGYNSAPSGSDGGHNSSAKSSISASTDSSTKDETPNFRFSTFEGSSEFFNKGMEIIGTDFFGNLSTMEASSVGTREPSIGLKLGKRTYFENTIKSTPFTAMPTPSSKTKRKNNKPSAQNGLVCCQVEGCNNDLSQAKEYHRKHRVCDGHSKSSKVIIRGLERRFCQQCSRFHNLCEFDEKKRSCRRRLSDHNARRRKPSPFYDLSNSHGNMSNLFSGGTEQMGFQLNNSPSIRSANPTNSISDNSCNPKFTLTKGYPSESNGDSSSYQQLHIGIKTTRAVNVQNGAIGHWPSKTSASEVFNPGSNGSLISPLDADRAPSLLSSVSWESIFLNNAMHENNSNFTQPIVIHAISEGVPLSSSDFWLTEHQPMHPRVPVFGHKQ